MRKSDVDEILVTLYLRLNGYFTTGLILHSSTWGRTKTEIDCVAIRHRYHAQIEREVETPAFLDTRTKETDVILAEVKSDPEALRFNRSIRSDAELLPKILLWTGIFEPSTVPDLARRLQPLLEDDIPADRARQGIEEAGCRVRGLLCCPSATESDFPNRWCLVGEEIFDFVNRCFNPEKRRPSCSTRYNFQQWGYPLAEVVRYFKNPKREGALCFEGLYQALGAV